VVATIARLVLRSGCAPPGPRAAWGMTRPICRLEPR
jgi:hypothetical protein